MLKKNIKDIVLTLGFDLKNEEYFFHSGTFSPRGDNQDELDFYSILLCIENGTNLKINHINHSLQPGSLLLTKPQTLIELPEKGKSFRGIILFFSKDFIIKNVVNSDLFKPFRELENHSFLKTELSSKELEDLLDIYKILDKKKDATGTAIEIEIIKSIYFVMVCEVAEIFFQRGLDTIRDSTRLAEIAARFQHLVKQEIQKRQPLKYYADQIFISEKYLIKAVQATLNTTPKKIINQAVTEQAKHLLGNPGITIAQIAENLLFADISSFSKFFKEQTGETPSGYRRKL